MWFYTRMKEMSAYLTVVDCDFEEIGNSYEKIKSQDITLHTTVKIAGEDYEVMFTDSDGE